MRILVDASPVTESGGGICTYFLGLLKGWSEAGFSDHWDVYGSRSLPSMTDELLGASGTIHRHGSASAMRRMVTQQVTVPFRARSGADILLTTTPVIPYARTSIPIVAVVYDLRYLQQPREFGRVQRTYRKLTYGYGIRRASRVLSISDSTASEVVRKIPGSAKPSVVYLGSDHVNSWERKGGGETYGLAYASWTNKRPEAAVRIWAILRERDERFDMPLHVVGAGNGGAAALKAMAREMGIADLVRVHRFLPAPEYQKLFASASVVLMPSTLEGFGLPVVEALRLGIPVVATDDPGMREAGGSLALYAVSDSPESFATACSTAIYDANHRRRIASDGRRHAERFTWCNTARCTRKVLGEALAGYRLDPAGRS